MATHFLKVGDRYPALVATLTSADGTAKNLTGHTVKFLMRLTTSSTPKVNAAAAIVTAASGIVQYEWGATDTDTQGVYLAEFEVTETSSGKKQTFPNYGHIAVVIQSDIA